jgi:hypothetical protein
MTNQQVLHGLPIRMCLTWNHVLFSRSSTELSCSSDGHVVSYDIPRVALQKTKYVVDKGLGGMMWWAVDEDWVEPAPANAARRHLKRKSKRACGRRGNIGFVHAAEPAANSTSESSASMVIATSVSSSPSDTPSSTNITVSATSTESTSAPSQSSATGYEAEGEKDRIQLYIGRSLVQVSKEGFEKYAGGLDTTWNVLEYPSSRESTRSRGNQADEQNMGMSRMGCRPNATYVYRTMPCFITLNFPLLPGRNRHFTPYKLASCTGSI